MSSECVPRHVRSAITDAVCLSVCLYCCVFVSVWFYYGYYECFAFLLFKIIICLSRSLRAVVISVMLYLQRFFLISSAYSKSKDDKLKGWKRITERQRKV